MNICKGVCCLIEHVSIRCPDGENRYTWFTDIIHCVHASVLALANKCIFSTFPFLFRVAFVRSPLAENNNQSKIWGRISKSRSSWSALWRPHIPLNQSISANLTFTATPQPRHSRLRAGEQMQEVNERRRVGGCWGRGGGVSTISPLTTGSLGRTGQTFWGGGRATQSRHGTLNNTQTKQRNGPGSSLFWVVTSVLSCRF